MAPPTTKFILSPRPDTSCCCNSYQKLKCSVNFLNALNSGRDNKRGSDTSEAKKTTRSTSIAIYDAAEKSRWRRNRKQTARRDYEDEWHSQY
jgi:hypothetical protein